MGEVKTIKDIDENTWNSFKSMAARNNMKMGKFFEKIIGEYSEKSSEFWKDILNKEKILSDEEARNINRSIQKIRKDKGFRI